MSRPRPRGQAHDRRVLFLALAAGIPGVLATFFLLWRDGRAANVVWPVGLVVVLTWLGFALAAQEAVVRPLQTLSNLIAALREGDFSFRARAARDTGPLGEAMREVNALAETLKAERLGELEASALLRTVMEEIDVAAFTFDGESRLRLVNRAGQELMGQPAERLLGRNAAVLGLDEALGGEAPRVLEASFPGGVGRFEVRRGAFRQGGLPHQLLVLSNLSRALRDEERQAWQRLIRVLGHELNNSLAPIKSIAGSLESLLAREPRPPDADQDMHRGLAVIASRAEALARFTAGYSRLARLPSPRLEPVEVGALVRRAAGLETRVPVRVQSGPDLRIQADSDQLEQLLINLLRNAAEASQETGGAVLLGWEMAGRVLEVWIDDEGPGLTDTANLFVPFFTTKPQGTGIGLVLSRQIAEGHGGSLALENRPSGRGCRARLRLPL